MKMDYKNYSLQNLSDWVHDALNSEATPQEIYDCITGVIQENVDHHKQSLQNAEKLLSLVKGNSYDNFSTSVPDYFNYQFDEIVMNDFINFENKKSWVIPVEVDGPSGEYFLTFPDDLLSQVGWEEGDDLEWSFENDGELRLTKINTEKSND